MSILSRELLLLVVSLGAGGYLAGSMMDGDPAEEASRTSLRGHENLLESVIYAPDGQMLISCGWDKRVKMWNVREKQPGWGREVESLPLGWHVFGIAMTPDGKHLAAGGVGGFRVWSWTDRVGWELMAEETGTGRRCVAAAPDCRTLAIGGIDRTVRLWDIVTRKETRLLGTLADELRAVEFSPDGAFLAASTFRGDFQLWDLKSGSELRTFEIGPDLVQSFTFAPDNRTLAVARWGDRSKDLILWDFRSRTERLRFAENRQDGSNVLAISPNGRVLASADKDRSIRIWDMETGALKAALHEGVGWVKTLAFSPDGSRIAFGGQSGIVQFRKLDRDSKPIVAGRVRT
jgi:WD40 repeat protein